MTTSHVLSGLIANSAELAGQIGYADTRLRLLLLDLDALDQTIQMFEPDIDLEEIRPKPMPPRHSAFKGQVARLLLDALRQEGRPMTVSWQRAGSTPQINACSGLSLNALALACGTCEGEG